MKATTEIITTSKLTAARIIGKKGATIINIKETTGAESNRIENLDETSFIAKGSNKSVTQTMKLMETITRNVNSIPSPTEKTQHHLQILQHWSCKFGNCCIFLHQAGPLDISNPSPEHHHPEDPPSRDSRHKERKYHRSRSKSRTKHRRQSNSPARHYSPQYRKQYKSQWRSPYRHHSPKEEPTRIHRSLSRDTHPRRQRSPKRTPPTKHRSTRTETPPRKQRTPQRT